MEEKKLYPLRFVPLRDEYAWGTEEFKLADLGYRDSLAEGGWLSGNSISEIMDTYLDRVVGESVFSYFGRQFPFGIKHIKVTGKMPLRVHPADDIAAQRYDFLGKQKLWYVLRCGKDARIALGFGQDTDASQVYHKCLDGSIADILNIVAPIEGSCFHITPGTPHAAFGDIEIVEISESSPLDFCMSGWGEPVSPDEFDENLNVVDALDFINYSKYTSPEGVSHRHGDKMVKPLVDIAEFTTNRVDLTDPLHIYGEQFDSPVAYFCLKGEASVQVQIDGLNAAYTMKAGDVLMIPAEVPDYVLAPLQSGTTLLETYLSKREPLDSYINPEATEFLDDGYDGDEEDEDIDFQINS